MQPDKLVADIIKEQSLIIGESLARSRAEITGSVTFKSNRIDELSLTSDSPSSTIEKLIKSYEEVFGQASVEVCISVIRKYPKSEIQSFLPEKIRSAI